MRLLVLGAFWLAMGISGVVGLARLNAPSGAGCFLTAALCGGIFTLVLS